MNRPLLVVLLLGLGTALGVTLALVSPAPEEAPVLEWLDNPRPVASFHLESEQGPFDLESLKGRWTIAFFGFLHCPDACPAGLSRMAALAASLEEEVPGEEVGLVFVSVDPARDTVAEVSRYARRFDSKIVGVTGREEELARLTDSLGIQFKVRPGHDGPTVAHSVKLSVIGPEGDLRGRFRPELDLRRLVRELAPKLQERG